MKHDETLCKTCCIEQAGPDQRRSVEALEPADKPWIAWDDQLTGFGVRVHPSGTKSFIVNYRTGDGGRKAPNKRVVLGHHGEISPGRVRRLARQVLDEAAADPAGGRPRDAGHANAGAGI